ncbi:hypothetical protein P4O66_018447 [Electrophorus voltai]|uniref:Uncharacterized protein n=1 Tax=Electrophorus voltai TaxID=2609070 RepID=A0AAD8YSF4_9TELE|nr:hypothetical protein P4O66_018447 [Electrophorus voltai]
MPVSGDAGNHEPPAPREAPQPPPLQSQPASTLLPLVLPLELPLSLPLLIHSRPALPQPQPHRLLRGSQGDSSHSSRGDGCRAPANPMEEPQGNTLVVRIGIPDLQQTNEQPNKDTAKERDSGRWLFRWDETPAVSTQSEFITSQGHQTRDSKSPGAVGTWASRRSQKKQDHVYFDDNKIPGKRQESTHLDQCCRGERPAAQDMMPVAILQATRPDPVPSVRDATHPDPVPGIVDAASKNVPGVRDATCPDPGPVPGARDTTHPDPGPVPCVREATHPDPGPVPNMRDVAHPDPVPVPSVRDAARSDPIPGLRDAARSVTRSVPVAAPPDTTAECYSHARGPTSSCSWSGRSHSTSPCAFC